MSDDLGLEFASAAEVSAAQQEFNGAGLRQAMSYDFNGGKGFSIPGLTVHSRDASPAPSVGSKPAPGFTP